MRLFFILVVSQMLAACNQQPSPNGSAAPQFGVQFSKAAAVTDLRDPESWCNRPFSEAVLINTDPANVNRRFVVLGEGVYRIVVQGGNMSSSFFCRKNNDAKLEVFSSDNFPMCLSNRANFMINTDGNSFQYNNQRGIQYFVEAQPGNAEMPVFIEFQPGAQYGLAVHRCADCR